MAPSRSARWPARFLAGARRSAFAAVLLLACALREPAGAAERMEGPPPWRIGGRVGFTLDTCVRPDSSGLSLDILLRVPPATLAQLSRDDSGEARLLAEVRVRGRYGARVQQDSREFRIFPGDSAGGIGRVLVLRFPAASGPCRVTAKLTDLHSHRPALLPGKPHEQGELSGEFEVPRPQEGRDASQIEFFWPRVGEAQGAIFERGGRTRVPNPDRLYGLFAEELLAGFEVRGRAGDLRPWHWVARVYDARGGGVAQRESTATAGRFLDAEASFDLSGEPAGGYELEFKAWQEGDAKALMRRERFSIGWQPDTWLRSAAEANDEVHFLLESGAEEEFVRMHPGEQEAYLEEFWRRRDPTPETALNEALETFRARIRYANANFTRTGLERGMFSDMGRVYIRYGEPSEILRQVIPAGESTLERQLQQILDTEDRQPTDVQQKGLGGDMRPFEVWIYEGDIPLPPDADPREEARGRSRRRLLFLFVDEQGTGIYRLRYSTE
ncbi:MAG: GWxTD domain-containing protein [Candidatus Eisenbacteria bacterium]|nr:GWxTD domain-containing protein [Candidatus Eisenbacteria bacterium]